MNNIIFLLPFGVWINHNIFGECNFFKIIEKEKKKKVLPLKNTLFSFTLIEIIEQFFLKKNAKWFLMVVKVYFIFTKFVPNLNYACTCTSLRLYLSFNKVQGFTLPSLISISYLRFTKISFLSCTSNSLRFNLIFTKVVPYTRN